MKPGKTAPTWFSTEKNHQVQARSPFSWFNYGKLRLVYRTPRWPAWVCLSQLFPGWATQKKYEGQLGYETCTFFSLVARCRIHCAILTSKSAPRLSAVNAFKFEMCFAPQRRALFQYLNFQKCSEPGVSCTFWLGHVLRATTRLNIWAPKSAPRLRCFAHFDFKICFVQQRSVLFQHLNFQKCSEREVSCTCWLPNVLRATTACNCSSLICPDGSAPAALASLLFDPPEPQIIRKTQCSATFLPFRAPESSFFRLFLFSDSSHLCFSTVHIVGSLTSKRSSIKAPTSLTHLSHNWNPWWPRPTFSECLQQRSENFRLRLGRPQGHWCFAQKKTSIFSETSGSALSKLWNSTGEKGPTSSSSGRPSFEPHLHVLWGKRW